VLFSPPSLAANILPSIVKLRPPSPMRT
jgi:hypothetical protein